MYKQNKAHCISPVTGSQPTQTQVRPVVPLLEQEAAQVCYGTVCRYTTEYEDVVQGLTDSMEYVHLSQHAMSSTAIIKTDSAQFCTSGLGNHLVVHS